MSASPKPIDAFRMNADECAKFDAPFAVLRLTPSQLTALFILWAYGRGAELIEYTHKALSAFGGQPVEFFDEHLPAAYQRLAEMNMPLFRQVQRGLYVPLTGYFRPSIADTTLMRQVQDEIESEHPVTPLARVQIATNVLRAYGAVLPEPEPEPGETRTRGEAKPRRIPTAPHALSLILRSADDIVTRANQDPDVDDVAYLAHATTALQARLDERRKVRQERIEGSATGEITAAEPSPSATVNSPASPDPLPTVISATVISPAAEPSPDSDANVDEREVWERDEWQPPLGPIAESDEGETVKEGNGAVVESSPTPARQSAEVDSSPARSNLSTPAKPSRWNENFNSRNLNDRLREMAEERGVNKRGYMSCPLHPDDTPSVHVTDDGERVMMRCFSCGKNGKGILDAIDGGIVVANVPEPPTKEGKLARIIATYVYRGSDGTPVYKVLRTDPKGFPTMRFDSTQGRYVKGMNGTARILYRLPELLQAAPAETVLLVEGEKTANYLARHGFVVVAIGGTTKWNPTTMVEPLRGRGVVVIPDNDEPGAELSGVILRALWGVAASVTELALDGLDTGQDAYDWLTTHGHTAEELRATVLRLVNDIG